MKKIALTVFIFAAMSGAFCFAADAPESAEALKAKIAKLESQIREDVEIIRALRAENRALKRQLRGIKRTSERPRKAESPARDDAQKAAQERREAVRERAKSAEDAAETRPESPSSSVWDHMFPF